MNFGTIRSIVQAELGDKTDLAAGAGLTALDAAINRAQVAVANWKDPQTDRLIRFKELYSDFDFQWTVYEDKAVAASCTTTSIIVTYFIAKDDDQYNDWILEFNGERRVIVDFTGATGTFTLASALTAAPTLTAADTISIYKRFAMILPSTDTWVSEHISKPAASTTHKLGGGLVDIVKVVKLEDGTEITRSDRGEFQYSDLTSVGDPSSWFLMGNRLFFNSAPDAADWFRTEYYRVPNNMSADSDEPELPESFHDAIVMLSTEWGFRRYGEDESAYLVMQRMINFMRRTKNPWDVMTDQSNQQVTIDTGGVWQVR